MAQAIRERITAAEYVLMPETNLPMELIDGEVIQMPSPFTVHQDISLRLLNAIQKVMPGGKIYYFPLDVNLDEYNIVQPDIFWVSGPQSLCKPGEDGWWHGAPDLVVEILSQGTGLRDRREKFQLYEKHGSREYWLAEPGQGYVEVWILTDGRFRRLGVFGATDTFESPTLGGAKIELKGIFDKPEEANESPGSS